MAVLGNLAKMSTATTGTGTITLLSAVTGFLSFADAGIEDGDTISYAIEDGDNREVGRGVYTSSGTTLTRSVLKSTNSNAAISLSGNAQVFITALAEDLAPASQSQAEAGTDNGSLMSPLRTAQAIAAIAGDAVVETFTTSGTFTKEDDDYFYFVELWGGGGGGRNVTVSNTGQTGGGGGGYAFRFLSPSELSATETVTVGSGGNGGASGGANYGDTGGTSSFGSLVSALGGNPLGTTPTFGMGGGGHVAGTGGFSSGGGGTGGNAAPTGSGGGGGGGSNAGQGGISSRGGNGGAGNNIASTKADDGTAPGGGGGASGNDGGAGNGARGEVRVTRFKRVKQ